MLQDKIMTIFHDLGANLACGFRLSSIAIYIQQARIPSFLFQKNIYLLFWNCKTVTASKWKRIFNSKLKDPFFFHVFKYL